MPSKYTPLQPNGDETKNKLLGAPDANLQKPASPRKVVTGFTHLHVHSHYSLLDGLSKIPDLLDYTKELGMDAIAITDHGVMYGVVEFYKEAKKRGIKPIIGMEAYVASGSMYDKNPNVDDKRHHLTLLAKNEQGYKNLIKLSTRAHLEGFYYKPRVDKKLLKELHEGIIALSGCLNGEVSKRVLLGSDEEARQTIKEYEEIFGKGNFYLEVQYHKNIPEQQKLNERLVALSGELDVPLVATQDSHYLRSDDAEAQDVLLAIQTGNKISDQNRMTMKDEDFSLVSPDFMQEAFADVPEAVENTQKIADACNVEIELGNYQLPVFSVPEGYDDNEYLTKLCTEGLEKRYGDKTRQDEVLQRLDYELDIIQKTGFASYFLIVQDFVNWAKRHGIVVGPGRGSAAGSIVAYLLNITNIDPLRYELLFERFLNPERISMPDIDLDFTDTRRDEVIEYVSQKYGRDHVAQIITFGTMAARVAIRDVGRVLDYEYGYCDKLAKMIPAQMALGQALREVEELKELYAQDARAKKLLDIAKRLEGVARHASTHACGVVIAKDALDEMVPCQFPTQNDKTVITQYEMHAVDELGLLKMDFLGLKNLTIIEHALAQIKKLYGVQIVIDDIPLNDKKTIELLQQAHTTGVFQLESAGLKRYLKELKPTGLEDIIAMVALYRPGPMELIPDFIDRKQGRKPIRYLHPKLEPILRKTYGIAVYQEQVLQIARQLAGFSFGEADVLRKAIGKKIRELLDEQKIKFIAGVKANGIDGKIGEQLFQFIEPFARYGFNRSHAACYAMIAYQTAYLKAHYPVEFMAALLNAEEKNIDRIAFLIDECKKMNIEVLPPDINESYEDFASVPQQETARVRFGLAAIKNVGRNVVEEIIRVRSEGSEFGSVQNFLDRLETKDVNKKSLESLIRAGVFDSLENRAKLAGNIETLLQYNRDRKNAAKNNQPTLFGEAHAVIPPLQLQEVPIIPESEMLTWEKELLGLYVSSHPLHQYAAQLARFIPIKNISPRDVGRVLHIGGIVANAKKVITKSGKPMLFAQIEDLGGKIEAVVFPSTYENAQEIFAENTIVYVRGRINDKDGELKIICEEVKKL